MTGITNYCHTIPSKVDDAYRCTVRRCASPADAYKNKAFCKACEALLYDLLDGPREMLARKALYSVDVESFLQPSGNAYVWDPAPRATGRVKEFEDSFEMAHGYMEPLESLINSVNKAMILAPATVEPSNNSQATSPEQSTSSSPTKSSSSLSSTSSAREIFRRGGSISPDQLFAMVVEEGLLVVGVDDRRVC